MASNKPFEQTIGFTKEAVVLLPASTGQGISFTVQSEPVRDKINGLNNTQNVIFSNLGAV
jgi:hypothetical protein